MTRSTTSDRRCRIDRLWFADHSGSPPKLWQFYHSASAGRRPARSSAARAPTGRPGSGRSPTARCRATSSGVPCGDDPAAAGAAFGPEVDDVVGRLDDVEVVLDDDDRVALVDELLQHVEQLARVLEVQAGRRLVEDVERAAGAALRQLLRQLDALRLAAGQRRRRLAERDVAEADAPAACAACWRSAGSSRAAAAPDRR